MNIPRVLCSAALATVLGAFPAPAQSSATAAIRDVLPDSLWYFAQPRPGTTPVVLAPGLVSLPGRNEARMTFSPDGRTAFFYVEMWPNPGTPYILESECIGGIWSTPDSASFSKGRKTGEPCFSPDGERVYLNATNVAGQIGSIDLSVSTRTVSGWSTPVSLGNPPNLAQDQYHACVVGDTSIYFSSSSGAICRCQWRNGHYEARTTLPAWINGGNTLSTWGDPYLPPDERFMIFHSSRAGGWGGMDLYVTYRTSPGGWTNPKNLGPQINSSVDELGGDVTPDGKFMLFNRGGDIYWVSASFIDSLRHTNFVPYARAGVGNRVDTVGQPFALTLPDTLFNDDDGMATLHYRASLLNGAPLPAWLQFDSLARAFSGTPDAAGNLTIKVTAIDTANAQASVTFTLRVVASTGVRPTGERSPQRTMLLQNYPDPFNPATTISFVLARAGEVSLKVFDLLGREVAVLVRGYQAAGRHDVRFDASSLASGVYVYRLTSGGGEELSRKMAIVR